MTSRSFDTLPPTLQEIADVAGLDAAMQLAAAYGGIEKKIPRRVDANHWLARCVGLRAAAAICDHYAIRDADGHAVGRFRMLIPKGSTGILAQARRRLARELLSGEVGVREAARRSGLGERAAWRMKAKLKGGGGPQGELF